MNSTAAPRGEWIPRRIVIDPETGVRYWDLSDCPAEQMPPGIRADHPCRRGQSRAEFVAVRTRHRRDGRPSARTSGQHRRAPRATGTRRRGSRRAASARGSPDDDDGGGDDDPDHVGRRCGECAEPRCRPGEATCARCRQRRSRARRRADRPTRPGWSELTIEAAAGLDGIAYVMSQPPLPAAEARAAVVA